MLVLDAIGQWSADNRGLCPSIQDVADAIGKHRNTVERSVARLRSAGMIKHAGRRSLQVVGRGLGATDAERLAALERRVAVLEAAMVAMRGEP